MFIKLIDFFHRAFTARLPFAFERFRASGLQLRIWRCSLFEFRVGLKLCVSWFITYLQFISLLISVAITVTTSFSTYGNFPSVNVVVLTQRFYRYIWCYPNELCEHNVEAQFRCRLHGNCISGIAHSQSLAFVSQQIYPNVSLVIWFELCVP